MGWIDDLPAAVVGLDTVPLIYFLEEHPTYLPFLDDFFAAVDAGKFHVVTSTVTLLECLVVPLRTQDDRLRDLYRSILGSCLGIDMMPVTDEIAHDAAMLRASHRLATADAIQLATCRTHGATMFLTNDLGLPKIAGIKTIVLDELLDGEVARGIS